MRKITEDFIGTCQICFGEFKVSENSHEIVLHGYRRPGDGYGVIGQCSGTGHLPFEYDCEQTKLNIENIRTQVELSILYLTKLNDGKVTRLTRYFSVKNPENSFKIIRTSEVIGPDSEHWDRVFRMEVANTDNDIHFNARTADYLQKMVDGWARQPIIGIDLPATGRVRPLRKAYNPDEADAQAVRAAEKAAREAKPGKLKVMVYRSKPVRAKASSDTEWRALYDADEKAEKARLAAIKAWVRANFEGKSRVGIGYGSDLPRRMVAKDPYDYDVVMVALPWEYRDHISGLLDGAVLHRDQPKEVVYLVNADETEMPF